MSVNVGPILRCLYWMRRVERSQANKTQDYFHCVGAERHEKPASFF
jgi:hypothetical protein